MNDKLTVIAHIRAKAGRETRVREVLVGLIAPTRVEAGCINYDLHVSQDDPRQFVFYENWASESHLEAHANSAHLRAFQNIADEILERPVEITKWRMLP
ncbi:MAG TPA: putative quinol monooxygenase [Candidatus Dormibacteraeota bacterium]|nr:putative quinol monooxygenase [Candidatus Dormibacteraeota bacterium]